MATKAAIGDTETIAEEETIAEVEKINEKKTVIENEAETTSTAETAVKEPTKTTRNEDKKKESNSRLSLSDRRELQEKLTMMPSDARKEDGSQSNTLFGNDSIKRSSIRHIQFVNTLNGVPNTGWDISLHQNGKIKAWVKGGNLMIAGDGGVFAPVDSSLLFADFDKLETIDFGNCFYTDGVENMQRMFYGCKSLTNLDINDYDTSNVTNMAHMFQECHSVKRIKLGKLDTSKVTNMEFMFSRCYSLEKLNLTNFDTSNATSMRYMFHYCRPIKTVDFEKADTSNVEYMEGMFSCCE